MSHVPLHARLSCLTEEEQETLKDWYYRGVLAQERQGERPHAKVGLWVVGKRRHGTSYIAEVAMGRLTESPDVEWEHVYALALSNLIRNYWSQGEMVRSNPDDYGLFLEYQDIQHQLEAIWYECDALWVDDFHDETVDVAFWRKHIQPYLERRVKDHKPTIVATTLLPDSTKMTGLQKVIEDLFVICMALPSVEERTSAAR